ncbi:hypothetical protein TNCV_293031 [Trichonephila clavipes]|nr:hypothetical protein TNCV_293031 [Trichonephila clavipes]
MFQLTSGSVRGSRPFWVSGTGKNVSGRPDSHSYMFFTKPVLKRLKELDVTFDRFVGLAGLTLLTKNKAFQLFTFLEFHERNNAAGNLVRRDQTRSVKPLNLMKSYTVEMVYHGHLPSPVPGSPRCTEWQGGVPGRSECSTSEVYTPDRATQGEKITPFFPANTNSKEPRQNSSGAPDFGR